MHLTKCTHQHEAATSLILIVASTLLWLCTRSVHDVLLQWAPAGGSPAGRGVGLRGSRDTLLPPFKIMQRRWGDSWEGNGPERINFKGWQVPRLAWSKWVGETSRDALLARKKTLNQSSSALLLVSDITKKLGLQFKLILVYCYRSVLHGTNRSNKMYFTRFQSNHSLLMWYANRDWYFKLIWN